jgi:hypothetical protein
MRTSRKEISIPFLRRGLLGEAGNGLSSCHRSCLGRPRETKGGVKWDKEEVGADAGERGVAAEAAAK